MSRLDLPRAIHRKNLPFALRHRQLLPEQRAIVVDLAFQQPQQVLVRPDLADIDKAHRDRRFAPLQVVAHWFNQTRMSGDNR